MKRLILLLALAGSVCLGSANAESSANFPKKYKEIKLTRKGNIKKKYLRPNGTLKRKYRKNMLGR
jgi:hypothetical protein